MKIDDWLLAATQKLTDSAIETARLDCLVLLEDRLQLDRSHILAHPEVEISAENLAILEAQLARRAEHEPLAYIRGFAEFYGRRFEVTPDCFSTPPRVGIND